MAALPGSGWPAIGANHPVNPTEGKVSGVIGTPSNMADRHAAQEWGCEVECECSRRFPSGSCAATNAVRTTSRSRREPSRLDHPLLATAEDDTSIPVLPPIRRGTHRGGCDDFAARPAARFRSAANR